MRKRKGAMMEKEGEGEGGRGEKICLERMLL